jgi:hypothetical protein
LNHKPSKIFALIIERSFDRTNRSPKSNPTSPAGQGKKYRADLG